VAAAVIIDTAGYQHDSLSSLPTAAATGKLSIIGTGGGIEEVDKTIQSSRSVEKTIHSGNFSCLCTIIICMRYKTTGRRHELSITTCH